MKTIDSSGAWIGLGLGALFVLAAAGCALVAVIRRCPGHSHD